ncbi:uncharacterized protein LOC134566055 [Pelobates fuscus]|uniref:uncharacterized protein LOC134566055 n=1 Tax=Pelobates fuscus TaxID=191477 RepID=UPI002FE47CB2
MTRKPGIILFVLHVYGEVFSCDALNVTQSPKRLVLLEGQSAVINCTWDPDHTAKQIRVEWRISNISSTEEENKTLLASVLWKGNDTCNVTQRNHNGSTYYVSNGKAELRIDSVTVRDKGIYFCEINIEIPKLQHGRGNGTELGINTLNNTDNTGNSQNTSDTSKYASCAGIALIPVIILIGYILFQRRKKERIHALELSKRESIELNQLNPDMNDADEHSSSSSNSVQWAISTLYESCDYFAMKNPPDTSETCTQ